MAVPLLEIEGTWEEIARRAPEFAGHRLKLTVLPEPDTATGTADTRPIEDIIADIVSDVPDEEWAKLPPDLSDQLDHYVYGTPKRE